MQAEPATRWFLYSTRRSGSGFVNAAGLVGIGTGDFAVKNGAQEANLPRN
jgi:hypothetical protein